MLTKQEIISHYSVNEHSIIESPGKFEGCMYYIPYYWDLVLEGWSDNIEKDGTSIVNLNNDDYKLFPEIEGYKEISLYCSDQGFIYSSLG